MKLNIILTWDPAIRFEEANPIDIIFRLGNGEVKEFKAQLKKAKVIMKQLRGIYTYATNDSAKDENYVGESLVTTPGKKEYVIQVTLADDEKIKMLVGRLEAIGKKHFMVTRNEWVNHEEYCTFFGSSGGYWDTRDCDYPQGDFIEELRQTVYDMETDPDIYRWTNVPSRHLLDVLKESDPEFRKFAERELDPLVDEYWKDRRNDSPNAVKGYFIEIADVAEKYQKEYGIKGAYKKQLETPNQ